MIYGQLSSLIIIDKHIIIARKQEANVQSSVLKNPCSHTTGVALPPIYNPYNEVRDDLSWHNLSLYGIILVYIQNPKPVQTLPHFSTQ